MTLDDRWHGQLERLRREGCRRTLSPPGGIDFTSNDYLGYATAPSAHEESRFLREIGFLARSGTASRLLRGNHAIWDDVEAALASYHGAEAALMMTSGYAANEGLLSTIIERNDWVASDELNHASIVDGLRLSRAERFVFRHNDLEHLESGLRDTDQTRTAHRQLFIVVESHYGMEGDAAPLSALVELAQVYGAHLIVDEAHATACFGPAGRGCVSAAGLRNQVLATVHTGGKALAVPGAYICGSRRLKELLINRCRHFMFTTALPPAVGSWWLEALARVRSDDEGRQALHENAAFFRSELVRRGVASGGTHYIVPIVLGDNERTMQAASFLQQAGYDIRAIRPPSVPPGTARLRISIHANHDRETLASAADAIAQAIQVTLKGP